MNKVLGIFGQVWLMTMGVLVILMLVIAVIGEANEMIAKSDPPCYSHSLDQDQWPSR